ncbi:MAG: hypothetical protein AAF600_18070 [Bacteroidota bacterium]
MVKTQKKTGHQKTILLMLWCLVTLSVSAQKIQSVSFSIQTESISVPFTRIGEVHPGIEIGFTLNEKVKKNSTRRWNGYVGWFYHQDFDQSFYLRGDYEFAYEIKNAVAFHLPIGIGYMHSFHPKPVYEQNGDGSFSEKNQTGRPHGIFNVGLGLSYLKLNRVTPFIRYDVVAQAPFVATVPVAPRNFLKIGSSIQLR